MIDSIRRRAPGLLLLVAALTVQANDNAIPAPLPEPVSNNAVAAFTLEGARYIMSFMGLGAGKTHRDISRKAWLWTSEQPGWQAFPDVPVASGRLAAVAVGLYDRIFLFGGYTVAEDGSEVSTPEVFIIDPRNGSYKRRADMPVPVDDSVAFTWANRYIYLVSGWHDSGNVSAVQVYDSWEDQWSASTDFPGEPVFGHAGGIVGDTVIIVGGVGVIGENDGKRQFAAIDQAWKGRINPDNPAEIDWQSLPGTEGSNRYRLAATGSDALGQVIFAGGTDRPYNFSGIGYDGEPATPTGAVFAFDVEQNRWVHYPDLQRPATMDHRGLLPAGGSGAVRRDGAGGLNEAQSRSAA